VAVISDFPHRLSYVLDVSIMQHLCSDIGLAMGEAGNQEGGGMYVVISSRYVPGGGDVHFTRGREIVSLRYSASIIPLMVCLRVHGICNRLITVRDKIQGYTGCFKKSFTISRAYVNLFRGHVQGFELS
jgi:hypothetical protein